MTSNYYQILGVDYKASIKEIKSAYRSKAKTLHPDVNDSPTAHDDFILLNEAYDYILGVRTGKISRPSSASRATRYTRRRGKSWDHHQRERAREKARAYARMKYEEFKKTERYKTTEALHSIADFLIFLTGFFMVIGIPIIGSTMGKRGLLGAGLFVFVTSGFWIPAIFQVGIWLDWKKTFKAFSRILRHRRFWLFAIGGLNVLGFFLVNLFTILPTWIIILVYAAVIATGFAFSMKHIKGLRRRFLLVGILPGIIFMLFALNYLIAFNAKQETYRYKPQMEYYSYSNFDDNPFSSNSNSNGHWEETTLIILEGNKYDYSIGIRFFFDREAVLSSRQVTLHTKTGILGIDVLKGYEFK